MKYYTHALSDVGKVRKVNEDHYVINNEIGLHIVCDGLGGHEKGDIASKMACKVIEDYFIENKKIIQDAQKDLTIELELEIKKLLENSIFKASEMLQNYSEEQELAKGMGTTAVVVVIVDYHAFVAHVGDSRLYLIRQGNIHQLTSDHSLGAQLLQRGIVNEKSINSIPRKDALTQAIGMNDCIFTDQLFIELCEEDVLLLCTDGLTKYANEGMILDFYNATNSDELCTTLVNFANDQGGKDNTTVVSIHCEDREPSEINVLKKIKSIISIPLFTDLTYRELNRLLEITKIKTFKDGKKIITEGNEGDEFFVLLQGQVIVTIGGLEKAVLEENAFFGEMSLVDKKPRSATITSRSETKLMSISRNDFVELIRKEPFIGGKILWNFTQRLSSLLRESEGQLFQLKKIG